MSQAKSNDFCHYLMDLGLLDAQSAQSLRQSAVDACIPIGRILILRGVLSMKQVMHVLYHQADKPEVRFGELAIREGFLSHEELESALREQRKLAPHPVEILLQRGILDRDALFEAMTDYIKHLEYELAHRGADPAKP